MVVVVSGTVLGVGGSQAAKAEDSGLSAFEKKKMEREKRKQKLNEVREKAERDAASVDQSGGGSGYTRSYAPSVPEAAPSPFVKGVEKEEKEENQMKEEKEEKLEQKGAISPPIQAVQPNPKRTFVPPQVVMPESVTAKSSGDDALVQWRQQQKKDLAARQKMEEERMALKNRKRRGAVPLWLAESLLTATFVGAGFVFVAFGNQVQTLYKRVDAALTGIFSSKDS